AEAQLHLADYDGALKTYTRALARDQMRTLENRQAAVERSPDDPLGHQALALVYAALGRQQAAIAEADTARWLMPKEPPDWDQFLEAVRPR
ncbi:MAG: hypothetical protein ACE5HA_18120, partial [Anaerolineae bacterium]